MKKELLSKAIPFAAFVAVALLAPNGARGATLADIGATAPTPGAADISQLTSGTTTPPDGLNYYDNNGNPPGQTFTTGANPTGYTLSTLAYQYGTSWGNTHSSAQVYTLRLYVVSTMTLVASYTSGSVAVTPGDWVQWTGLSTALRPNTTYAYSVACTTGYNNLAVASGNLYSGGEIALLPVAGGTATTGGSHGFDGVFDIGLTVGGSPAIATVDTWNGGSGSGSNWSDLANWNGATPASGDFLVFDGSAGAASANDLNAYSVGNLAFASTAGTAFTLSGNGITLACPREDASQILDGGGILNYSPKTQTLTLPVTLAAGNHALAALGGNLNLSGAVTRNVGATAQFAANSSGKVNLTGSGFAAVNGILGGWATLNLGANSGDWATLDASQNVVAYSAYTTKGGGVNMTLSPSGLNAANNIKINSRSSTASTLNSTTAGTYDINTLLWSIGSTPAGDQALTISSGQILRLGTNGAIMNVHADNRIFNVGNAGGGTITAGGTDNTPGELSLYAWPFNNGNQRLVIGAAVNDNGTGAVRVNVLGDVVFQKDGTFSGGLYINRGRAQANTTKAFGTGPVYVAPGGTAFLYNNGSSGTFPNNFFVAGFGSQDVYALRVNPNVTLSGTITLTSTALIGAGNNNATFSGHITGPGGLWVRGAWGAGSLRLGESSANDYAGDTIIDSTTGYPIRTFIDSPAHSNLMPSGTGAGNLVLAGGSANLAQFDVAGSVQTVNGLVSTNNAAQTLVTSNPGGGTLSVGANNATSRFDGVIGTSAGNGTAAINLTKIGSGTLTLGGANNYTGSTLISNGVLALGASGSIGSSAQITVGSGATFDVSAVNGGFALGSAQTLSGFGTVSGATTINGTLAPGSTNAIGTLSFSSAPALAGTLVLKLNRTNAQTADTLAVSAGTLTHGGALIVTNIGPALQAGDSFTLLTAPSQTGTFSSASLPTLGIGQNWWTTNDYATLTVNQLTAGTATYTRAKGLSLKIRIADLLTNVSCLPAGGNAFTLTAVGPSTNGATLTISGGEILFAPANDRNESVSYFVSDSHGGSATGQLNINVAGAVSAPLTNNIGFAAGTATVSAFGIPGYTYVLQTTTNLNGPWWPVATNTAAADGSLLLIDPNATNAQQYYRSAQP